jgi:D-serine deaminase-like pyridoxal phosphate-dependent protein
LRCWDERRQAIAQAVDGAGRTRDLLARYGIACPTITGAGNGSFEFEAASGLYTELQCGSYIFMDADYRRNRARDGGPFATFEPSLFVWATVMSRPAEDRAIGDAGLKALAFDSGPPLVSDEPAATYERASDEHGRLALSAAANRLGLGDKIRRSPATATRPSTSTTGMSVSAATASSRYGRSPPAGRCFDLRHGALPEAGLS